MCVVCPSSNPRTFIMDSRWIGRCSIIRPDISVVARHARASAHGYAQGFTSRHVQSDSEYEDEHLDKAVL